LTKTAFFLPPDRRGVNSSPSGGIAKSVGISSVMPKAGLMLQRRIGGMPCWWHDYNGTCLAGLLRVNKPGVTKDLSQADVSS
jgi:hypothetical protein